jgi:DnaJ-class molecular chaperone
MSKKDYYAVLGLERGSSPYNIKQNYRKLALKWHPDKCFDKMTSQQKFNEIQEAYNVLSDAKKKEIYDVYGHQGLDKEGNGSSNATNFFFQKGFQGTDKSAFDVLKDIFQDKDDDDLVFENYEGTKISETIKSFMDENIFSEKEGRDNFFETYQPTFMNPQFFMEPPTFNNTEYDNECTTHFFSFLSTDSGEGTYSRTSTTVFHNGKGGNNFYQKEESESYSQMNYNNSFEKSSIYGIY